MANLIVTVLFVSAVALASAQTGSSCKLSQEVIQMDVMNCMMKDPILAVKMVTIVGQKNSDFNMDFVCQNRESMVSLLWCMEDKLLNCYESVRGDFMKYMPNQDRWNAALQFVCDHKSDFSDNCMDMTQLQQFRQCYMEKLSDVIQGLSTNHDVPTALCSMIKNDGMCIEEHHGTCSKHTADLLVEMLDKLFPDCPAGTVNAVKNNPFRDMMLHGQPLLYEPKGSVKYN